MHTPEYADGAEIQSVRILGVLAQKVEQLWHDLELKAPAARC
jgi:hypothetical protein